MQLFHAAASPFVRKVMVVLHETAQLQDVEIVPAIGHPMASSDMPLAHNPLGKIPALQRPDGPALYDSRVICEFLSDRAGAQLYPAARKWEAMTLEATADGIMDAAVLMVYETRCRPDDMQFAPWVDAQWDKVARALDAVNARWMSHLAGPLDIGHIAMGCALSYLDFRHADRDWRQHHRALAAWEQTFAQRDSMQQTQPS
ncbi:glutathione S-transferase [Actibacterium sp. 188UL27-1]|uniref:glutathione S-transferase n=1 Tax=Actibacterium sp. 188UL27-1 TaxID=2786961 RepID=UPI00195BE05A|nr:glutathione S-transferase [Actibacterium sp. 188UL27-1]MBM7069890.1 glutathione S-transferase [Actibacterium sp. 188UL27-1]